MPTLLLRLTAPLQSWGSDSKFDTRYTENAPTKSGLVGMIAAAFGRRRDESLEDLTALKYGIRTDQPGEVLEDFHTARKDAKTPYITRRYYLCDAVFVGGIEAEDRTKLEDIEDALKHPEFPLFLGRRSCPPDPKLILGIVDSPLREALENYPLQGRQRPSYRPLIQLEGTGENGFRRIMDDPVSYNPKRREYRSRLVSKYPLPGLAKMNLSKNNDAREEHDPFAELEEIRE